MISYASSVIATRLDSSGYFPFLAEFHLFLAESEDLRRQPATEAALTHQKPPHRDATLVE